MENFDARWAQLEIILKERFGKVPDVQGLLFLIGINELGAPVDTKFTKEQKQDLMHIAVCTLLSRDGYFEFAGRDDVGWPHFNMVKPAIPGIKEQEQLLKECMLSYFEV